MMGYSDISMKPQRRRFPGAWTLLITIMLFALTLMGVALLEAERAKYPSDQQVGNLFLIQRLWTQFRAPADQSEEAVVATVERIARDAVNASRTEASRQGKSYYEEQQAVVVREESAAPPMAERRDSYGPPQSRAPEEEVDESYEDYRNFYDALEERYATSSEYPFEGRANQARPQNSYYASWQYPTQTAAPAGNNNRKLQPPPSNRPPYPAYDEVYDYPMGFQLRPHEPPASKQVAPASVNAVAHAPASTESSLVTFLKMLKQMWDLYQALMHAWSSVAERHQQSAEQLKKERLEKQRLRQQQQNKSRITSKKPQRIEGNKGAKSNQNNKAKTTTMPTTITTSSSNSTTDSAESEEATATPIIANIGKGESAKGDSASESSVRGQRHRREPEPEPSTDVGEGRYIKGDPLKGYYDFVITEGSYKFWAVFQVGTALLIIYSTFAAIYYSKVNPLTSDYDYQDYLGAGRSMTGGDDDFVDDNEPSTSVSTTSSLMNWLPRTAHSLKFILDAIDKLPLDHDKNKEEAGWSGGNSDADALADADVSR